MSSAPNPTQVLLTDEDVARLVGLTKRSFQNMVYRGDGPTFIRITARTRRFRAEDVKNWLDKRQVQR